MRIYLEFPELLGFRHFKESCPVFWSFPDLALSIPQMSNTILVAGHTVICVTQSKADWAGRRGVCCLRQSIASGKHIRNLFVV